MTDPRDQQSDRDRAARDLQPGEQLRWAGHSDPRVLFTPRDAFLVPFSLLWCSFIAFWISQVVMSGAPPFFLLFGAFFALVGVHLLIGRFVVKARRKRVTVYAVTDRRAFASDGRTTRETPVTRADRTVRWSRDRAHCSVLWDGGTRGSFSFLQNGNAAQIYANTGLDGLFAPVVTAFWDVADGEAMLRALDDAGAARS